MCSGRLWQWWTFPLVEISASSRQHLAILWSSAQIMPIFECFFFITSCSGQLCLVCKFNFFQWVSFKGPLLGTLWHNKMRIKVCPLRALKEKSNFYTLFKFQICDSQRDRTHVHCTLKKWYLHHCRLSFRIYIIYLVKFYCYLLFLSWIFSAEFSSKLYQFFVGESW